MKRPKKENTEALAKIGIQPIATFKPRKPWQSPAVVDVIERTGQTFAYHTCDFITASWAALQEDLNERQRDLEAIYGPWVECINVYRKNSTKDDGHCVVAIFKIFLGLV